MMRSEMEQDILKVLVTEEELKNRVAQLGEELYEKFQGKKPLFLGVLKGSFVFMTDLVRSCQDITGRHLIIVEDILDSGNTLAFLKEYFLTKGAASITIVTLLDKPARREKAIQADLSGFTVPDEFVVGYGLDYAQMYRNIPYIGVLKPEVYAGK